MSIMISCIGSSSSSSFTIVFSISSSIVSIV